MIDDDAEIDPPAMIRPRRKVEGISAVLLPFTDAGEVDWPGFSRLIDRTAAAGLIPAVNMDTGFASLIDEETRCRVLDATAGRFVAGVFVPDKPGSSWDRDAYLRGIEEIASRGGTPILFPSYGLNSLGDAEIVAAFAEVGRHCDHFLAFELGEMFAPFGRIYSLEVYRGLLGIPSCRGAKHSSLRREAEWRRLRLRDRLRPDFRVYTGNDLAIDMIVYGSDYLLGIAAFAPAAFARRDTLWEAGDAAFYELNDALQYLGNFAFRPPVPAYRHSAAMFLKLAGTIASDATHPGSPRRPNPDRDILAEIARRIDLLTGG